MSDPSSSTPSSGIVLGSYRILELLGEGGMAHVYLAEHVRLGRRVALKLLLPELAERPEIAHRFFSEARAVNAIRSEHIVDITDFVEEGKERYFVMEVLDGPSLGEAMQQGQLSLERVLDIALQLARTLELVHAAGVLHRDLKPDNVMLVERAGRRDWVKLLDFGIAKFMDADAFAASGLAVDTSDGAILGTPAYLAPELLQGKDADFRADVYSFGLVLYQMVTGKRPFASRSLPELILKQMSQPAPRLADLEDPPYPIPAELDSLVRRCLEKPRDLRPPSMKHVVAELEMICEQLGLPLDGGRSAFDERTASRTSDQLNSSRAFGSSRLRGRPTLAAGIGVAAVVVLGITLAVVLGGDDEVALPSVAEEPQAATFEPEPPKIDPRLAQVENGGAAAVLAALESAGEASWSGADHLVRGHALFALERPKDAWAAYDAAVGGRVVDERLLARAVAALQERSADPAMDVLASWPDGRATAALRELLVDEGWWPRHHALKILDDRGESSDDEHASMAILDVDTGPTCGTRRYGLKKLREKGSQPESLAAVERAAKRKDNRCLRKDLEKTRAAIAKRMRASEEPAEAAASDAPSAP